jgi:EAL domain-containing protein (putative c-di-GMP-specific phosphodiesterase class I)
MMANPERALEVLTGLHSMNVHLSVDDFGTGFSSLAYLRKFPVSSLKIDKSFVMNMASDENDTTIVVSTIELAHNLGLSVVAEGVENEKVLGLLAKHGCDIAQGYYLGRPMPQADITRYLEAHRGAMEVNKLSGNSAHKSGRLLS